CATCARNEREQRMGARRILVVDDCGDTVEIMSTLLTILGHECRGASTGAEAIEEAVEYEPDLVLLDIALPDISGYDVARVLRARCRHPFYLAALTGWSSPEDVQRAAECGFDQHLLKPIRKDTLSHVVERVDARLERRGAGAG